MHLTKLGVALYSVVVQASYCEGLFSQWGQIHGKVRNRLDAEKTHQIAIVRNMVREHTPKRRLVISKDEEYEFRNDGDEEQDDASENNPDDADDAAREDTPANPHCDNESGSSSSNEDDQFDTETFFELLSSYGTDQQELSPCDLSPLFNIGSSNSLDADFFTSAQSDFQRLSPLPEENGENHPQQYAPQPKIFTGNAHSRKAKNYSDAQCEVHCMQKSGSNKLLCKYNILFC